MQTRKLLLSCVLVIAGVAWFAATEVIAADPLSPAVTQPPSRECTIPAGTGSSVTVQAGPDGAGGLAPNFPLPQSGEICAGLGSCLEWRYLFTYTGLTPQKAALTVDTDITVQGCNPACQVTQRVPLVSEGERTVVFNATTTALTVSYSTPLGVGPGTMTASFVAKKGTWPRAGLCALAGADSLIAEHNVEAVDQVVRSTLRTEAGEVLCTVDRIIDAEGRTTALQVVEPATCTRVTDLVELRNASGAPALFIGGDVQITFEGSHKFCWASTTTGQMICVQTPTH